MTLKLRCHHGHSLEITAESTAGELICHRCGSVIHCKPSGATRRSQSVDITIDSQNPVRDGADSKAEASDGGWAWDADSLVDDPESSMFLTLDHATSADACSGNPAAAGESQKWESHAPTPTGNSNSAKLSEQFDPPQLPGLEVLDELGRGGMGVVYRVRDKARGREVALKTLQRMNPDSLQRFKQEFRVLADIAHPNLAALYELLSDGQTWCFSMEILEGVEFLEYVWSGFEQLESGVDKTSLATSGFGHERLTDERMQRLRDAMTQLASGLNALHAAGILHTDIKPSNVLVTTEGRLVLLDFGLAAPLDQKKSGSRLIQGTPRYMSPEQANAEPLTEASDWYSVGVMLYEVLTGRLPMGGNTMQLLAKKRTKSPVQPFPDQPANPKPLNDLCMALLDPHAKKRPSVEEVLRCFQGSGASETKIAPRRAVALKSVELVGRERHFERLHESFAKVSASDTLSLFVHGKSGMGKSVLVRSFLDSIKASEQAIVLEGRCYEQESVPFKALDSLIDALAVHLAALPHDVVHGLMPRDRKALSRVFPVLGGIPEAPHARYPTIESADQQELRQRAMNALRELLQRLAIREPLVLYIDDLQWGDDDSAALLADLVRPPDAPQMLLLGSYRTEDVESSSCLRALAEAYQKGQHLPHREELAVESLAESESMQLALTLLGRDDETNRALAKKIAQESRGWPFFVWELVQYVQDDPTVADQSLELDDVIWARVNRLPKKTIQLLELIAVAGRPLPTAEAYQALDAVSEGPSLLAQLRTSNLIRSTESAEKGTVVESYHDRIREAVFSHLDGPTVKGHNLCLALMTEQASGLKAEDIQAHIDLTPDYKEPGPPYSLDKRQWQRVFDAAYFFDAAGEHQRALPFALIAAEQAWSQNALDVAEQQFNIAARGAASGHSALRFRIAERLGDVLTMRARYEQAGREFELARSLAENNVTQARIDGKRGYLCFKQGDMANAARFIERALSELGDPPPSNVVTRTAALLKEVLVQTLHTYLPSRFVARCGPDTDTYRLDMLRAGLYDGLGYPYWFTKGPVPTLWTHLRHMNLAERYPPSQVLGKAYAVHGVMMTAIPLARRGADYAEQSYKIHGDLEDRLGQGKARSFQTFALLVLARFKEACESGQEAVELLEQAGDVWEANMARMIMSAAMYFLGDLQGSCREAKRAYEIGKETGDYSAMALALAFWLPNSPASIPPGAIQTELERQREDPLSASLVIQARGLELLLCEDQPKEAAKILQQSLDLAKRRGLRNVCVFSGLTWKATALRVAAERELTGTAQNAALREAKKAVRAALKITRSYFTCRAQALRERALLAVLEGNEAESRRYFDDSLRVAEEQEARYERAKSLLARAEAGLKFRWPEADQQRDEARRIIDEIEQFAIGESSPFPN